MSMTKLHKHQPSPHSMIESTQCSRMPQIRLQPVVSANNADMQQAQSSPFVGTNPQLRRHRWYLTTFCCGWANICSSITMLLNELESRPKQQEINSSKCTKKINPNKYVLILLRLGCECVSCVRIAVQHTAKEQSSEMYNRS